MNLKQAMAKISELEQMIQSNNEAHAAEVKRLKQLARASIAGDRVPSSNVVYKDNPKHIETIKQLRAKLNGK